MNVLAKQLLQCIIRIQTFNLQLTIVLCVPAKWSAYHCRKTAKKAREYNSIQYENFIFLTHSHCHRICWWSFNVSRVKKERHEDITFFYKKKHYTAMHVRPEVTPTTVLKALFNYLSDNFREALRIQ